MSSNNEVCLVVPSIREKCLYDFIERWNKIKLFDVVDLLVVEDNDSKTFNLQGATCKLGHFSWEEIDAQLGDSSWIIPRRSDTVRSFGYYEAWKQGYKYVITLDDDCYPTSEAEGITYDGRAFVNEHLKFMKGGLTKWHSTLSNVKPRGIPYFNVGARRAVLNHGLWTNVLDYDAPTQLVNPAKEKFSFTTQVIPAGFYFPMCGMNVAFSREIAVLTYHLMMGKSLGNNMTTKYLEVLPFDRFGDIWSGIFMKKIVDHLGLIVTSGLPYIHHERASNPFTNLKKEANGLEVNEFMWEHVDKLVLVGNDPVSCYEQLALHIADFVVDYPKFSEYDDYFHTLGSAMSVWAGLFKE